MELREWRKQLEGCLSGFLGPEALSVWRFDPVLWLPLYERGVAPEDAVVLALMADEEHVRVVPYGKD